ncbi:peptidase S24 [Paludibacter sp. 221]|uniref:S24 family peptidase n=1 Tax=Paludibacter sp. 221 TaxID=2302939 RepID=UPI0013D1BBF3|nr:S24 family peptidase [Paludibacter sp. 221]NDV47504.1 peptidase S24 [Paludibacter sp. 221]
MSENERLKKVILWLISQGIVDSQENLAQKLGYNASSVSQIVTGRKPLSEKFVRKVISLSEKINSDYLLGVSDDMLKIQEAAVVNNPSLIYVPMVSQYAYAGYLTGFGDEEYIETLPTVPFIGDHLPKGEYMAFEVRGDSMENGSEESILEGDVLMCRKIKQELWRSRLHINRWDFVIVHRTEGVLVKRIVEHDVERCTITIHSLNEVYPDRVIPLNEVAQLFNVIQVSRNRRR